MEHRNLSISLSLYIAARTLAHGWYRMSYYGNLPAVSVAIFHNIQLEFICERYPTYHGISINLWNSISHSLWNSSIFNFRAHQIRAHHRSLYGTEGNALELLESIPGTGTLGWPALYSPGEDRKSMLSLFSAWWYTYPCEKWWSSSVGMMKFPWLFPIYGKIIQPCSKPPTSFGRLWVA